MARIGQKQRQWLGGYSQNPGEKGQWFGPGSRVIAVEVVVKFWTYCVDKARRIDLLSCCPWTSAALTVGLSSWQPCPIPRVEGGQAFPPLTFPCCSAPPRGDLLPRSWAAAEALMDTCAAPLRSCRSLCCLGELPLQLFVGWVVTEEPSRKCF